MEVGHRQPGGMALQDWCPCHVVLCQFQQCPPGPTPRLVLLVFDNTRKMGGTYGPLRTRLWLDRVSSGNLSPGEFYLVSLNLHSAVQGGIGVCYGRRVCFLALL